MPDRFSSPTRARRIFPYVVILLVGLIIGAIWFAVSPVSYTAESRLAIGQSNLSASQVPGYTAAEATLASNYARLLQDTPAERLAITPSGSSIRSVIASPIPDSSIIRVQVVSASRATATLAAKRAAVRLKQQIDKTNGDVASAEKSFRSAYIDYINAKTAAESATNKANLLITADGPLSAAYKAALADVQQASAEEAVQNLNQLTLGNSYQSALVNSKNAAVSLLGTAGSAVTNRSSIIQKTFGIPLVLAVAAMLVLVYARRERRAVHANVKVEQAA